MVVIRQAYSVFEPFMRALLRLLLCVIVALSVTKSHAAVAVVSNRVAAEMRFTVTIGGSEENPAKPKVYSVPAGDLAVINIPRGETAKLSTGGKTFDLNPDAAYYVGALSNGEINLVQITLSTPFPVEAQAVIAAKAPLDPVGTAPIKFRSPNITVKIFVDEEEATRPAIWSRRLRARLGEASEILQKSCGIGLDVVDVGNWKSDDRTHDFNAAYAEFVQRADPGKAQLAIGFTSQYQTTRGRTHVGGTYGPLQRHILLREWSNHLSESEKLEVLVHELGHHLGATHSPERDAVMRPVPADRQSREKKFNIHFDPLNALAINLVAEEIRDRGVKQFVGISLPTKLKLRAIYTDIAKALPDDITAARYIQYLGIPSQAQR
jgi:hypothetical protein